MAAELQMAPELDGLDPVVVYGETDDRVVDIRARRHFLNIQAMADDGLVLTSLAIDRHELGPVVHAQRVCAGTNAALLAAAGRWLPAGHPRELHSYRAPGEPAGIGLRTLCGDVRWLARHRFTDTR